MAPQNAVITYDVRTQLQSDQFKSFIKMICSRRLRTGDLASIERVTNFLTHTPEQLKTAIFYLECASWNVHDALLYIEMDTADREDSWIMENSNGRPANLQQHNLDMNRQLVKIDSGFDEQLFEIRYKNASGASFTISFTDTARQRFTRTDQDMVDDLNRWRRANIWKHIGPDTGRTPGIITMAAAAATPSSTSSSSSLTNPLMVTVGAGNERWHPLQERYLRNRFAFSTTANPGFKTIFNDYVSVFKGVYLPGRTTPCTERSQNAVTSFLHRECINKVNGNPAPKSYTSDILHNFAKSAAKQEWIELLNKTPESDGDYLYPLTE